MDVRGGVRMSQYFRTDQVDDSNGSGPVFSALGKEEKSLARLGGPGSGRVSYISLLVVDVSREVLVLHGVVTEPEEFLRKAEAPVRRMVSIAPLFTGGVDTYLTSPGAL
jgi:hypothetical protein